TRNADRRTRAMQFFKPKLIECLRNYDRRTFFSDLAAGVTVGIVALPLAIGFGIASGVTPAQGLWTAIIAGAIIAALGGSKVQIGGPTGAFVPILAGIVTIHGYAGLALATVMAGIFLVAMGALKLGSLIKFIPYPVIAGFTSGIAVIIFIGQLKEFFGVSAPLPRHTLEQIWTIGRHLGETHGSALALGLLALAIMILWPKKWQAVPTSIVAVVVPTIVVVAMHLGVETSGTRFGGLPSG